MSTGNENFITIDSIAEIQDITNGDFLFTINNGVIYKLDFENFIIGRENTDFFTTIDSMSAQLVANTKSLCAINAYVNESVKPAIVQVGNVYNLVNELSANWTSTYSTINTLSASSFLPIDDSIVAGSMLYYNGETGKFTSLPPGNSEETLSVNTEGIPTFSSEVTAPIKKVETVSLGKFFKTSNRVALERFNLDKTLTLFNTGDNAYQSVQINYTIRLDTDATAVPTTAATDRAPEWTNQTVDIYLQDNVVSSAAGIAVMNNVGIAQDVTATITGDLAIYEGWQSVEIILTYIVSTVDEVIQ